MVRTQHLKQMASNMELDSSSEESEEQIQVVKPKKKMPIKTQRRNPADRFKRIVITVILAIIVLLLLHTSNEKQTAELNQTAKNETNGRESLHLQQAKQQGKMNLVEPVKKVAPSERKQGQMQTTEQFKNKQHIQKIKITKLLELEQIGDSYFLTQNMREDTIHWFKKKQAKCISDQIINSASTLIKGSLYAQKTAYEQITVLLHNITIPAQNIYQYETPRQFIHSFINNNKGRPVLYDHDSPLLLILTTIECIPNDNKTFLLVSNRRDRRFMQKNLIFNDLLPIANFQQHEMLINHYDFQLMITDDWQLAKRLMFEPQGLSIIIQIKQTKIIQQQFDERVRIYRFGEGKQCELRQMSKWQSSSNRQDSKKQIQTGWYVFLNSDKQLPTQYLQPAFAVGQTNKHNL